MTADLTPVPNTKPTVQREKLIAALTRCVGLHTSTTCLDCPYRADPNEPVHYGDVSCKDALLRDCHIALTEYTPEMAIMEFAELLKNKDGNEFIRSSYEGKDEIYWFDQLAYENFVDNLVKGIVGEK